MIEETSILAASGIALAAGLASFLSPCVLPLAPVYLASLVGPEIFDDRTKRKRLPVFLHSLSFVVGFSVIFSLWKNTSTTSFGSWTIMISFLENSTKQILPNCFRRQSRSRRYGKKFTLILCWKIFEI